jgi:hypothetical protein
LLFFNAKPASNPTMQGIVDYFLAKIEEHPVARFIAVFDPRDFGRKRCGLLLQYTPA